jgi:hypothetical protein
MERKKVLIGLTAVLIVVAIIVAAYYVVFQRPIKSQAEDIALNESDLTGWNLVKQENTTSWDVVWAVEYYFFNSSVDVGNNLTIALGSYTSSDAAHQAFSNYVDQLGPVDKTSEYGDESIYFPSHPSIKEPDGTYRWIEVGDGYMFRVANVVVSIWFGDGGSVGDSSDSYNVYHRAWMDDIVQLQVDKLEEHNIHLF